jgi:hypothetical protein
MDAIACAFYGIKPFTYRRKSRKFSQHELLENVLQNMASQFPIAPELGTDITILVDQEEWSSFDMLKREFQMTIPRKSLQKFQAMVAMFLYDEYMNGVGLQTVISTAVLIIIGRMVPSIPPGVRPTVEVLGNNVADLTSSLLNGSTESLSNAMPLTTHSWEQSLSQSLETAIDGLNGKSRLLLRKILLDPFDMNDGLNENVFSLFSSKGLNLEEVIGDAMLVVFAAAASESIDLVLVEKINEQEWIFKSKNQESTQRIIEIGKIHVLRHELLLSRHLPHI